MNSLLSEIYSTILPSAPYIVAAYCLVWACVLVWVLVMFLRQNKLNARLNMLEEELESKKPDKGTVPLS